MSSAPWLSWLPRRAVASRQPSLSARPMLECLESREAPGLLGTTATITSIGQSYNLLFQNESVNVQITNPLGGAVSTGFVAITDNGQTQTVAVNGAGQASANFSFNLFLGQAIPSAHTVSATFTDPSGVFGTSTTSATAPDTTGQFIFVVLFDILLIQSLSHSNG